MRLMYVFTTWVIANLLHPLMFVLFGMAWGESFSFYEITSFSILLFVYSLLFSLPSLAISWLLLFLIVRSDLDSIAKYLAWLFLASALPVVNLYLIILYKRYGLVAEDLRMALPATAAVMLAVLIRHKAFFKLFNPSNTDQHETNMV